MKSYSLYAQDIMEECRRALLIVDPGQTEEFLTAVCQAENIFFIGIGRVMLSLQAIAKRWAHIGLKTHVVGEITEPAITPADLLIVGSGSGESLVPVAIARKAKDQGAKIGYIGSNIHSTAASLADVIVRIPVRTKLSLPDEIFSAQPMTSLFEQALLLYGDTLTAILIDRKRIVLEDLWLQHANLE